MIILRYTQILVYIIMKRNWFLLFLVLPFFLSACGDVTIPESFPEETTSLTDEQLLTEEELLGLTSPTPSSSEVVPAGCEALQQERDNLSEAITLAQEEIKTCKAEKESITGTSASSSSAVEQLKTLEPIIADYIANGKKDEFKFDLCGGIGRVTQELWYSEFQKSLEAEKIMFKAMSRALIPSDFYSVCFSNEGKMAVFLGASNQSVSEFHLIKYDFDSKKVQEAYTLGGSCENCPNQFGKRVGPAIVLFNKTGARITEYNYFYDMNVLQPK